jgi:N-terminal glycosyl-hydrolase-114-associated domain/Right handed beta helix region
MRFLWTLALVVLLAACAALQPSTLEPAAVTTLSPVSYTTTSGTSGGQPVASLALQDQAGSQNDFNKYLEFTTPNVTYAGYRSYTLPTSVDVSKLTALTLKANFLGPLVSDQTWTWKLYNWSTSSWVTLGNNTGASWSAWKAFSFNASGTLATYVSSSRELRVRIESNNAADDADLDYEALVITTTDTTPPPSGGFYVATTGSDTNPGTQAQPWRTIQKAANTVTAGSTVYVRGGVYNERVTLSKSGTAGSYITFQSYPGETAIVDGTGLTVPAGDTGLFLVVNKNYLKIRGFEIRNYKTATLNNVPVGINVRGTSNHIELRNNKIYNIETNVTSANGGDAHGIAVYGTSGTQSLNNVIIDGNELYNLKLGSSEALVINGNVDAWQVTNNKVHDVNNIGIDAIGAEGTAPANDAARNGLIAGNDVYNIDTYGNPAYGTDRSAGCIYVDGGTNIIIERNKAHACNIGIELASERQGKSTSYVTVRNNFIYRNTVMGIAMGGYEANKGKAENNTVVGNTLFENDTLKQGNGELLLQYNVFNNTIKNNIFYANNQNILMANPGTSNTGNQLNNNSYFAPGGVSGSSWQWKNVAYSSFSSYKTASGNDANSQFVNPQLVSTTTPDLHVQSTSPTINVGVSLTSAGSQDIDSAARVQGTASDIGADEVR